MNVIRYHINSAGVALLMLVALLAAACAGKPEPYRPGQGDSQWEDTYYVLPDGNVVKPDTSSPEELIVLPDGNIIEPDNVVEPDLVVDVEPDTGPVVDTQGPEVVGAFSADGTKVSVRFNEEVDAETAGVVSKYSITGSDMSQITIKSVEVYKQFAHLTLSDPGQVNSSFTYTVLVQGITDLAGNPINPQKNKATIKRSVYLTIVWHQHQPFYLDPVKDELTGPWVRKHSMKSYYDMASILENYPDIHFNMNITPVLLIQLLKYYVERMEPYVDMDNNTVDAQAFLKDWKGRTDPWIDLLLEPTPTPQAATEKQLGLLYKDPWSCVSTSDQIMKHFPQYVELRLKNPALLTQQDFLKLKILFEVAWFDPDFLMGPVNLPDGRVVDMTDFIKRSTGVDDDGAPMDIYTIDNFSEEMANRIVAEQYKIMANIIAIHKKLVYDPDKKTGQIEISTTPFYHPILPLVFNTDLAKQGQPYDSLPFPAYGEPSDASAHVLRAIQYHTEVFGVAPRGTWCGEGSVAEDIVPILVDAGLSWTATDQRVMEKSTLVGGGSPTPYIPYKVDSDTSQGTAGSTDDEILIVFRDTDLSNKVGFTFQMLKGTVAADEFMKDVLKNAPNFGGKDRLVTVILDGENAWESYKKEHDGKGFFHALYSGLSESFQIGEIVTVTLSEYIEGNPERGIPPHPIAEQKELEPLFPGSWIEGTFAIWIGESEENQGWDYLRQARAALHSSGLAQPNPALPEPADENSLEWLIWKAYDEVYAAEGSDWFWWYGSDMTSPSNDDTPFDKAFRSHLHGMYTFMNQALVKQGKSPIQEPEFAPIVQKKPQSMEGPFEKVPVLDGVFTPNEGEWDADGGFFYDNDSGGTMAGPGDDIAQVYFGYMGSDFYLGLLFNEDLSAKQGSNYSVSIYTNHKRVLNPDTGDFQANPFNTVSPTGFPLEFNAGGAAWEIKVDFSAAAKPTLGLRAANGSNGWTSAQLNGIQMGGPVAGGKLLEFKIPFAALQMQMGDPLEFAVVAAEGNNVIDTAPYSGSKVVFEDITTLIYVTFEVDVTGTIVPINAYTNIATPPPPAGNGIVYIAGDQDAMGSWIPNKVPLVDNGVAPDKQANDKIWTGVFGFAPGTVVRYKYTIGLPKDEASWYNTEEFPLTERGLNVTQDPQYHKMFIRDVFADRPNPSGTQGPNTTVELKP